MERWLIDGELREKPLTVRNRFHSRLMITVGHFLEMWSRQQPAPRGEVVGGEAGFRLSRNPDSTAGVDVAYAPPELLSTEQSGTTIFEGAPLLAVEILSLSDTQQEIHEKIRKYLEAGTKLVWVIDPEFPTITVYEAGKEPVLFNREQELTAEPYLPGFRVAVSDLL